LALQDPVGACKIISNGQDPSLGVYAVVLTQPAPCDFKLPRVTVSGGLLGGLLGGGSIQVPVGSYWSGGFGADGVAHSFSLVGEPSGAPRIDNGFLLVQPDNKTYLLVDAGSARPDSRQYQSASDIANQLSQSLGWGSTTLLQPDPGSEADDYATATVFKKGSVIAIYDDTPDMAGHIEVEALLTDVKPEPSKDDDDSTGKKKDKDDDPRGGAETIDQPDGDDPGSTPNSNDSCT
jgi:hypothetical protein